MRSSPSDECHQSANIDRAPMKFWELSHWLSASICREFQADRPTKFNQRTKRKKGQFTRSQTVTKMEGWIASERSDLTCLCLSAIGELGGTPVYVMPVSCPAQSELISIIPFTTFIPPCSGLTNSKQVNTLVAPPTITGMCHIQIIEEPEEKFR